MKRILMILAICLSLAVMLCACGGTGNETPETEGETVDIMQKSDPAADDTLNILMIGNSFCYYYPDELYGIAKAAGVKIRVCNVYYSGCTLEQHWNWWKNEEANYQFFTYDESGKQEIQGCDLTYCLEQQNWDVISIQEGSARVRKTSGQEAFSMTQTYITELLGYIREQYPQSKHYWHQTWAYQTGYDMTASNGYKVETLEEQKGYAQRQYDYAKAVCNQFGISRVNTGEAWQLVREKYGYDNLCARMGSNGGLGDFYHDGDIGGGQYLNACVWFEVLTGQSCVGNTFRPDYQLSEDMITMLQQAAHEAVA